MTCKDCNCYDVCAKKGRHFAKTYGKGHHAETYIEDVELKCKHFKDKSDWVHLPCRVGDTVYVLSDNDYDELKVSHILIEQDGIPRAYAECPVHSGKSVDFCDEDYCGRDCCMIIFSKHNDSRIRFTKEEAEKALERRQEDAEVH